MIHKYAENQTFIQAAALFGCLPFSSLLKWILDPCCDIYSMPMIQKKNLRDKSYDECPLQNM